MQESKAVVVLKRSPKWWIGMAAVGGLLVGAGSGTVSPHTSNNQQFSQTGPNGSEPRKTNQQQNSQMAITLRN